MNFDKCSEKELLTACIQGDKKSWDVFVEKYTDLVYHTIHKTRNIYYPDFLYQELEDIHNTIFISLIDNDYKKPFDREDMAGMKRLGFIKKGRFGTVGLEQGRFGTCPYGRRYDIQLRRRNTI